jgi:hypothetical protein
MNQTIRASSSDVRAAFAQWLGVEFRAGIKLVILEGLTASGKTTLTKMPFDLDGIQSTNIEMDGFLPPRLEDDAMTYIAAIDRLTMLPRIEKALSEPSLVIIQGAIVWPLVESVAFRVNVRRVYLKRMMHLLPDFWADEDFILEPEYWPPTGFHRSIYKYHEEQRPWLKCDLIIERIEERRAFIKQQS